jgi:hypothetical protein
LDSEVLPRSGLTLYLEACMFLPSMRIIRGPQGD